MFEYFKKLFSKKSVEPVQAFVAVVDRSPVDKEALSANNLGIGFWVMTPEGVGIVTGCSNGLVTAALCKADGTNKMTLDKDDKAVVAQYHGPLALVRRAYIDEFPNRNPDVEDYEKHIRRFGYIHSSEAPK